MRIVDYPPWMRDALCTGSDPELWFPSQNTDVRGAQREAKAICAECPVRARCLERGLYENHGLWGGLNTRERINLRIKKNGPDQVRISAQLEAELEAS